MAPALGVGTGAEQVSAAGHRGDRPGRPASDMLVQTERGQHGGRNAWPCRPREPTRGPRPGPILARPPSPVRSSRSPSWPAPADSHPPLRLPSRPPSAALASGLRILLAPGRLGALCRQGHPRPLPHVLPSRARTTCSAGMSCPTLQGVPSCRLG